MNQGEIDEIKHYKINKPLPETLTIEDIISDMKKSRFFNKARLPEIRSEKFTESVLFDGEHSTRN